VDPYNNPQGLRFYVAGTNILTYPLYAGLGPGSVILPVEVYRGPTAYEYDPVPLYMQSACDQNVFSIVIVASISYVRPCAKADFYLNAFQSFNVKNKMCVFLVLFFLSAEFLNVFFFIVLFIILP
jgi:hypothetical protein